MPNIITHTLFSEQIATHFPHPKFKAIIKAHPQEFRIGANGPDFLFFHDVFPVWKKQDKRISNIGTAFHRCHINDFYQCAIQTYLNHPNSALKDAMASYIIAHFLHWQLDSVMHPYVVYRTGFKEKLSTVYHHRFESMMDAMLLKTLSHTTIRAYKTYTICTPSLYSVDAISSVYIPCVAHCLHESINKSDIEASLNAWAKAQRYLYDPYGMKTKLIKGYEWLANKPYLFTGNIVPHTIDTTYDVLNQAHTPWRHPCTGETCTHSVLDLLDIALQRAHIGIPYICDALEGKGLDNLLDFLSNISYNNGLAGTPTRLYKDVIYHKMK